MGQPTNLLLGGQAGLLGADPELYRQQLLQQEQARIAAMPAQNQLAGTLGGLLGRGLSNVAQDRGFFEVTNPVLQKLTSIQSVYNRAMQESDPNDPMSFYKNLQTGFANAGLGQQALMATQELKKFEDIDVKSQSAKLDLYAKNPDLLQTDIAKFREQGNDKKANELAGYLGKITAQQELARAKDSAQIGLIGAQTESQKAMAKKHATEVDQGKVTATTITDRDGGGTIIYADKTGKEVNRIVVTSQAMQDYLAGKGNKTETPPKGEKRDTSWFQQFVQGQPATAAQPVPSSVGSSMPAIDTPAATAPVAAPTAAAPVANVPALDPQTRIYYAARDPVLIAIKQAYAADPQRLATDPAYFQQLTKARNDQIEMLKGRYGNMVSFEGL
jgi:hypothetical protein